MANWDVTITDNQGGTHSPELRFPPGLIYPRRIPAANGRPRLQIAVHPDRDASGQPRWFQSKFDGADVTVTLDGTDEPVDTLIDVDDSARRNLTILTFEGGSVLDERVERSFGVIETHQAARDVVESVGLGTDVPTPSTTVDEDVLVQDKTAGLASSDLVPPGDDSPVHVTDGGDVTLYQTLFFHDPSTTLSAAGDEISYSITTDYSIPANRVAIAVDTDIGSDHVGLEFRVDGLVVGEIKPGADVGSAPVWVKRVGADDRLAPGDHTVTIAVTEDEDAAGNTTSDATPTGVALYDDQFTYTFDADLVDGPGLYPQQPVYARLREPLVTRAVVGASFRGFWADNTPGGIYLSNGQQQEAQIAGIGPSLDADYDQRGAVIDAELGLEAYGSDSTKTPESGFKPMALTGYRLTADLEDMPLVVGETVEGTLADVLTDLGDVLRGDFVWVFDTDSNGNDIIRFVRSGSQTTTVNNIEDYTVTKQWDGILDEVTVNGGDVRVTGEGVRVQHDQAKPLNRDRLVEGSETVEQDGTTYERGVHYDIDYEAGTITATPNPTNTDPIPDATRVSVSYEFQPQATLQRDGANSPIRSETVELLALRSDRACRLAAKQLLDAVGTPSFDAEATLRGNTTYSAVTELASGRLPASSLETVDIEATPAGTDVRLEARSSLADAVGALRDRISSVARNTR